MKLSRTLSTYTVYITLSINVVSADTLRDAQLHPENYRDLIIRVAGYTAFFTEISKDLQDDLIARVEFNGIQ